MVISNVNASIHIAIILSVVECQCREGGICQYLSIDAKNRLQQLPPLSNREKGLIDHA